MIRRLRVLPAGAGGAAKDAAAEGPAAEWWAAGVRFGCTGSGQCCTVHGDYAYVFLRREDERRLAAHLGVSVREVRRRYTRRIGSGQRSLIFPEGSCVFLDGRRCGIYEARPRQCRTWPFWEENLDPGVWEKEVAAFCPGVGRGRLYTEEEIRAILAGKGQVGG